MTDKQRLALKAVMYGCSSNRYLNIGDGGEYYNKGLKAHIDWQEALDTVYEMYMEELNK